jgi:hypothetical protein
MNLRYIVNEIMKAGRVIIMPIASITNPTQVPLTQVARIARIKVVLRFTTIDYDIFSIQLE